jgi:hypothetical protein
MVETGLKFLHKWLKLNEKNKHILSKASEIVAGK